MNTSRSKKRKKCFDWTGLTADGFRTQGELRATHKKELAETLSKQQVTLLKAKEKFTHFNLTTRKKLGQKQIALFTKQLASLVTAKIPLKQALHIIRNSSTNKKIQALSQRLESSIVSGSSFTEALKQFPQHFNALYCGLTRAGEQSGKLDSMLNQLAAYQERSLQLKTKIKKAMIYPSAVFFTMISVTTGLLLFVIPQFQNVFNSFGAKLPAFTSLIIQLANLMNSYSIAATLIILLSLAAYYLNPRHHTKRKSQIITLLLKLPILNRIIIEISVTRWIHVLATLLNAGLPITEALTTAQHTLEEDILEKRIRPVLSSIKAGETLHHALQSVKGFPTIALEMIAIGENTGELGEMLGKMNEQQQAQLNDQLDHLSQWLEPAMMMLLAVLVGGLIIAMYLPIFQMGSVI